MKNLCKGFVLATLILIASPNNLNSQTFTVDTIQYHGDVNYYINLVMLGDGFLESELPEFRAIADEYITLLFTVEPFARFRNFFNAFSISVPSNEQGAAMDPSSLIDNYFGSTFNYAGIERLLVATRTAKITSVLANNFPAYDQVFMLVNSDIFGGSGGWVATASLHENSKEIAIHELGHSFADLADEYWAGDQYAGEARNMTQETSLGNLKWRNWYGDFEIGLYPHAESPSWYRPHEYCLMRYLGEYFCAVCSEGVIESIYTLASPFKGYEPENTDFQMSTDSTVFKLLLTNPDPNTLKRTWYLNGSIIGKNMDSVIVRSNDLADGVNIIKATVMDTTSLIRPLEHEIYHQTEVEWRVSGAPVGTGNLPGLISHSAMSIYPNPVDEYLQLKILGDKSGLATVELYDAQGRQLQSFTMGTPGNHTLETRNLKSGIYMLRIERNGKYISTKRFIKK